jgi:hypothetical protein
MALAMIDATSSWFEIVELPIVTQLQRQTVNGKEPLTANKIFDKSLDCIAKVINKSGCVEIHGVVTYRTMEVSSNCTSNNSASHMV